MLMKVLTVILLVCFFALMIGVGLYTRRKATDVNGFVLGGRSVGPWLTAFAFGTSYFSAVIFVGYAGQFGWRYGLSSTWAGLGNAFIGSLLAWNILGRRTRVLTQHFDAKTMPDYFGKRFESNALKVAASAIVFIFLIPYTASLYNGLSSLFGLEFNIPYWIVIVVMAVLTGIYVIVGGYMATAINDFIQGIIMLFGISAVIFSVLHANGGLLEATKTLSGITGTAEIAGADWQGAYTAFFGPDPLALLFVVILTSLGTWGLPQMVGKFYSIKSENDIHKGTVISTVFAIIVAGGCYFLGGFGRLYTKDLVANGAINVESGKILYDKIVPTMLSNLPAIIIAIVIVLVLSASMSTLSSLVLTSSSTLTLDVIKPILTKAGKKELDDKKQVLIMRIFIVFFIAVSAAIAILKDSYPGITFIAQMMGVSWGALAGAFLAPYMLSLYSKKVTKASAAVCFVWGCSIAILQLFVSLKVISIANWGPILGYIFKSSINSGVVAMVGGLVIVPIISLISRKPDAKLVDAAFEAYDMTTTVKKKENLGD